MSDENPYSETARITSEDIKNLNKVVFDEKFKTKTTTIDQLYDKYSKFNKGNVSVQGFRKWIAIEFINYHTDKPRYAKVKQPSPKDFPEEPKIVISPEQQAKIDAAAELCLAKLKEMLPKKSLYPNTVI